VSSLVGTFPKTKWAQILREKFCESAVLICCYWAVLYGSVQSVQQGERARFSRQLVGMKIEVV
jgi:hypothetical protein